MRKFSTLLGAAAMTMSFAQAASAEKLTIYHWFEYIPQELLNEFTTETGIEVVMDTYDSNEALLANLKATGMGSYDIAFPSDYMVNIMRDEGMLDTFTSSELKNFDNIQEQWLNVSFDMGRQSSVPYQWGSTSFMVDRNVYSGDIRTSDIIFNPPAELKGKINVLDTAQLKRFVIELYDDFHWGPDGKNTRIKNDTTLESSKRANPWQGEALK
ncbi:MAG: hypothetical protein ACPHW5_09115, partial [Candidatus Puniceispirillales bacterium]